MDKITQFTVKPKYSSGFILGACLGVLVILSLLAITLLMMGQTQWRIVHNTSLSAQAWQAVLATLKHAEQQLEQTPNTKCIIPTFQFTDLSMRSAKWWQNQSTCSWVFAKQQTRFLIEKFGTIPCLELKVKKKPRSVLLYRITAFAVAHHTIGPMVQTTIALATPAKIRCQSVPQLLRDQELSWRQIK